MYAVYDVDGVCAVCDESDVSLHGRDAFLLGSIENHQQPACFERVGKRTNDYFDISETVISMVLSITGIIPLTHWILPQKGSGLLLIQPKKVRIIGKNRMQKWIRLLVTVSRPFSAWELVIHIIQLFRLFRPWTHWLRVS